MAESDTRDVTNTADVDKAPATEPVAIGGANGASSDPFAAQRTADNNPFGENKDSVGDLGQSPPIVQGSPRQDRKMSKEWDASKVPPSRFQKREGSIYATPGSRDSHTGGEKGKDSTFHQKLKEKGWFK